MDHEVINIRAVDDIDFIEIYAMHDCKLTQTDDGGCLVCDQYQARFEDTEGVESDVWDETMERSEYDTI